jgi:hypothetical protein
MADNRVAILVFLSWLATSAIGCVPTESLLWDVEVVTDRSLERKWDSGNTIMEVKRMEKIIDGSQLPFYDVKYTSIDGNSKKVSLALAKLKNHYFINTRIALTGDFENIFCRVSILGNKARLRHLSEDALKKQLKSNPGLIKHKFKKSLDGGKTILILTGSTEELKAFVLRNVENIALFSEFKDFNSLDDIEIAPSGLSSKSQRTFDYWYEMKALFLCTKFGPDTTRAVGTRELRRIADELDSLPTLGVDTDAVELAVDMASIFTKMADYVEKTSSVSLEDVLEISTHALSGIFGGGDPFQSAKNTLANHAAILKEMQGITAKHRRTRALLTGRYNIEFPDFR